MNITKRVHSKIYNVVVAFDYLRVLELICWEQMRTLSIYDMHILKHLCKGNKLKKLTYVSLHDLLHKVQYTSLFREVELRGVSVDCLVD